MYSKIWLDLDERVCIISYGICVLIRMAVPPPVLLLCLSFLIILQLTYWTLYLSASLISETRAMSMLLLFTNCNRSYRLLKETREFTLIAAIFTSDIVRVL